METQAAIQLSHGHIFRRGERNAACHPNRILGAMSDSRQESLGRMRPRQTDDPIREEETATRFLTLRQLRKVFWFNE